MTDREADILYIKRKKVKHWTIVLFILIVVTICMRVQLVDVDVQGNDTYTDAEAEQLIFSDYWDRNTVVCIYKNIRGIKKDLPFVEDYKIVIRSPFHCELRFYEKKPIGCIRYMSNFMYFDKDGMMIESAPRRLNGIPIIEGLDFGYIVLGKKLPVDSSLLLNSIMSLTQQLSLYDIACSSIKFNDTNNTITAVLEGGDVDVYLGNDDGLAAKISVLNDMLPEIQARKLCGTLDLSSYDDSAKGTISSFRLREGSTNNMQQEEEDNDETSRDTQNSQ